MSFLSVFVGLFLVKAIFLVLYLFLKERVVYYERWLCPFDADYSLSPGCSSKPHCIIRFYVMMSLPENRSLAGFSFYLG